MTRGVQLNFADSIRSEFDAGGYLHSLTLVDAFQRDNVLTIQFEATHLRPGRYALEVTVPRAVGDDQWRAYTESDTIKDWTRWGIAVPLLEAFETQATTATEQADHSIRLQVG